MSAVKTKAQGIVDQKPGTDGQKPKEDGQRLGGTPNIQGMSKEEILELLSQRRSELNAVAKVAKEKGVKLPTTKKTTADQDRLMEFFNRVGYSTGMEHWARSRRSAVLARIAPVLEALGAGWNQEKQGEAVEAMVAGFREARIQTSFPSTSMPEKKVAEKVPSAAVWKELQPYLRGLPDFVRGLLDEGAAKPEGVADGGPKAQADVPPTVKPADSGQ